MGSQFASQQQPGAAGRHGRVVLVVAAVTATSLFGLTGCSSVTATKAPTNSSAGKPVQGGTLTVARTADIFTFDPYNTQDDRSIFTEMELYERLVKLGADGKSTEPELATSWSVASNGMSATFQLRSGVQFSDGTPMTADDVVFSLKRDADQRGSWGFLFSPVKDVTKVNDHEVKITTSQPFAPLLPALSTFAASIYSKANSDKYGKAVGSHPLGTGAFKLDTWNKGSELILGRNPHYWQQGLPHLDKVIFKVVGDDNSRVLQLESGAVDALDAVSPEQVEGLKSKGVNVTEVNGTATTWAILNEAKKPLNEANVRLALAWAIDRNAVASTAYFGQAKPATSILPSSSLYATPDVNPPGYDLNKAKQYLSQSSVPNGFALPITIPAGDSAALNTAEIWAASLKKIGITLKINQEEATTAQDEYNTEKFTVRIAPWTNDTPDPDELLGVGLDYKPQNGLHTGYRSEQARALVTQARQELDPTKRGQLYRQLLQIANRDMPFIPIVEVPRIFASASTVHGFTPNTQGKYGFVTAWKK